MMNSTQNLLSNGDSGSVDSEYKFRGSSSSLVSNTSTQNETRSRDPVIIERRNLVNISKLIVKELIDTSMKYGRMLDSDHRTLQHFFIVLEHVLRHGLRPKKGILGPKKELWDILQSVEKIDNEARDMTTSIRDLPTVKTHMGRARAWLRVALMQKKLADYLRLLTDHKEAVLADYYEPDALMMSEEAVVLVGLLVGLNVIDCNLCIKGEDLDSELGVIDFSLYLRSNYQQNNCIVETPTPDSDGEYDNMSTVLDQKNYVEELNRHLNATVANLQSKVEQLTTTNALMKEDLEISKANMMALMHENSLLKTQQNQKNRLTMLRKESENISKPWKSDEDSRSEAPADGDENLCADELMKQLNQERKLRKETERELNLQTCVKTEMEVAMKLLEKDIHEKQDTIISLRKQLEDIKMINLEMYKKLQECEEELTQKAEVVTRLQLKTLQIGQMLNNLQKFNHLLTDDNIRREPTAPSKAPAVKKGPDSADAKTVPDAKVDKNHEGLLKHKIELVAKLESKSSTMVEALKQMDEKTAALERDNLIAVEALHKEKEQLKINSEVTGSLDGRLKFEKDKRETLEKDLREERDKVNKLKEENVQLKNIASNYAELQERNHRLEEQCNEQEKALEELGAQFGLSKLQVSELKEEMTTKRTRHEVQWTSDKEVTHCKSCSKEFNMTRRKHHCRHCGDIFCSACSDNAMALPGSKKAVRVCDNCHHSLLQQYTVIVPS